jgi:hypothetical protein
VVIMVACMYVCSAAAGSDLFTLLVIEERGWMREGVWGRFWLLWSALVCMQTNRGPHSPACMEHDLFFRLPRAQNVTLLRVKGVAPYV